jgi:hypothetical protein
LSYSEATPELIKDEVPTEKRWEVIIRGTKFTPRYSKIISAEVVHRNKFGDLLFLSKGEVIASYNRQDCIGCTVVKQLRKPSKNDKEKEIGVAQNG